MTKHLPECCFAPHVCDVNFCQRCHAFCICKQLRACEERAREDERSNNFTPDDHSDAMTESYHRGFDDARWIAAKEALQGVQHEEPCDCEPCKAITRALAELRTIGQD